MKSEDIFVTKPSLPQLESFLPYLEEIWSSQVLTNAGKFHNLFETALAEYLGVKHVSIFANGTLALLTAIRSLDLKGEVITTPYSFVATAHSLLWNDLTPVFVDVDPFGFNMDASKIEAAITDNTSAILPVHCYGYPCDVEKITKIAKKHDLAVIYDAAHAFDVRDSAGSILKYGDLSILSFHATKVFNTFEGGAVISSTAEQKEKIDRMKNFGITDEVSVVETGINGKMNEFQSALGLLQLKNVGQAIRGRGELSARYDEALASVRGVSIMSHMAAEHHNYAYYPLLIEENYSISRDELYEKLRDERIFTRRYFYPLISSFSMYNHLPSSCAANLPCANAIANQVLCLPLYPDLCFDEQDRVIDRIQKYS
ncbi:DegT/DnrJ/EryC1/StrS family aminotransferase [Saccharophagus degradans]|uniref:DegT/DnrJ/EryC1/StrS family aminotransferase n=1 Tax=Saccharophagus degradans TaxID=86304 RepID=UPI0024781C01|nr:DegT/DnrJ/EryC1/StrS family aminotransferase [Saccharophagus degradans]WGP00384.1 DegT/DnrJ/EryC1/StrS family aminotransferase [Saccharophagus degradans]